MSENILPRIPGQYVAEALNTLPSAQSASADTTMDAVIDVPGVGTVRITASRFKHRRGKAVSFFWTAIKAVAV